MENVQDMSKPQNTASKQPPPSPQPRRRLSKSHADYWKARLYRNTYTRDGQSFEVGELCIKVQHLGKRHTFSLGTLEKDAAAKKAKQIYSTLLANGWDSAMAAYNPEMVARKDDPTIGEFLADVQSKAQLRARTFRNYASCLRTIAAGAFGVESGACKFDYRGEGNTRWREQVDRIRLTALTPDKVQAWKVKFLRARRGNPAAEVSAKRTINSYIRCARSLFSAKLTRFVGVRLPTPLPFDGVELEKAGSMRYTSSIRPEALVADARAEFRERDVDCYRAFLLALLCGLRRGEIDNLEWSAFDWDESTLTVQNTAVLTVKTDGSEGTIDIDHEVRDEFRSMYAERKSEFVIHSDREPRPGLSIQYYRCENVFTKLTQWLRSKGVKGNKPIHTLRKEFGSLINQRHGLFAASQALRHSDITTSARHYVAKKERLTAGLGKLLAAPAVNAQNLK